MLGFEFWVLVSGAFGLVCFVLVVYCVTGLGFSWCLAWSASGFSVFLLSLGLGLGVGFACWLVFTDLVLDLGVAVLLCRCLLL